jgi:hypothetical protein
MLLQGGLMSKRSRFAALAFVAVMLTSALSLGTASADTVCTADDGCFTQPFSPFGKYDAAPPKTIAESEEFPTAASAVVLPTGQILYWNGLQNIESCGDNGEPLPLVVGKCIENSESKILDLTGTGSANFISVTTNSGDDLFCADQRLMQNGKVIVAGGTYWADNVKNPVDPNGYALGELYGSRHTRIFHQNGSWGLADEMKRSRWYPSMVTLPSGNMFIAGGTEKLLWNSSLTPENDRGDTGEQPYPQNVRETETFVFDAETGLGEWQSNGPTADVALPQFARLHLLPSGEILYTGTGQMWGAVAQQDNERKTGILLQCPGRRRRVAGEVVERLSGDIHRPLRRGKHALVVAHRRDTQLAQSPCQLPKRVVPVDYPGAEMAVPIAVGRTGAGDDDGDGNLAGADPGESQRAGQGDCAMAERELGLLNRRRGYGIRPGGLLGFQSNRSGDAECQQHFSETHLPAPFSTTRKTAPRG